MVGKVEALEVKHPRSGYDNSEKVTKWSEGVYSVLSNFRVSSGNYDFLWRTSRGALKTGEFVSRYNIPGTKKTDCVFCKSSLETVGHIFGDCPLLREVKEDVLWGVEQLGETVIQEDRLPLLCTRVSNATRSVRVTNMIGRANRTVWSVRNDVLFNNKKQRPELARSTVKAVIKGIIEDFKEKQGKDRSEGA